MAEGSGRVLDCPRAIEVFDKPHSLIWKINACLFPDAVAKHVLPKILRPHFARNECSAGVKRLIEHFLHRDRAAPLAVKVREGRPVECQLPRIIVRRVGSHRTLIESCRHRERLYNGTHFVHIFHEWIGKYGRVRDALKIIEVKCRIHCHGVDFAVLRINDDAGGDARVPCGMDLFKLLFKKKLYRRLYSRDDVTLPARFALEKRLVDV